MFVAEKVLLFLVISLTVYGKLLCFTVIENSAKRHFHYYHYHYYYHFVVIIMIIISLHSLHSYGGYFPFTDMVLIGNGYGYLIIHIVLYGM